MIYLRNVISFLMLISLAIPCTGEEIGDLMKSMPKSELHLHIGGSWPLRYLKEIANPKEIKDLCTMLDDIQNGDVDYHSIFNVFNLVGKIMHSDERIENGIVALCEDLVEDNVVYVELRSGLKDLGSGLEGYLTSILKGIERGTSGTPLKAAVVLSLRRDTPSALAEQTIDLALKYRDRGVVGVDVSGDSVKGDGKGIFTALLRAKENNLPITLHIGESTKETPQQQMLELSTIKPQRIGHGVHLCKEGMKWIKEKKVLVELCLTSAVKAGMITDPSQHPALGLLVEKHPVAICTDDPLIFNITLSEEYAQVAKFTGLLPEEIQELQKQNYIYNFCSED